MEHVVLGTEKPRDRRGLRSRLDQNFHPVGGALLVSPTSCIDDFGAREDEKFVAGGAVHARP